MSRTCHACGGSGKLPEPHEKIEMTFQLAAEQIRAVAKKVRAQGVRDYTSKADASMKQMVLDDAKGLRAVATLLLAQKPEAALERAHCMDTAAREQIPEEPWNFMFELAERAHLAKGKIALGA